jgi:hypothetical protein
VVIPTNLAPLRTYYDPSLWDRLAPAIREHQVEKAQHLVDGRWKTLEEAREMVGYMRALEWIFAMAAELTKAETETEGE